MTAADRDADEPRLTIVHDYLTQRGGAERVVLAMLKVFPKARLATLFYDGASTFPEFADFDIQVSPLNRLRHLRQDPRRAFPLLARAVGRLPINDTDVVLCSSSGWAHGVSTTAAKVVYCHNPARWLYQSQDYMRTSSIQATVALALQRRYLLRWDAAQAAGAFTYLANSRSVAERILHAYGVDAEVIPPPVTITDLAILEPLPHIHPDYFLIVGRNRGYKNVEIACAAFGKLPSQRLVVVGGLPPTSGKQAWPANIVSVRDCSDAEMRWLYANCRAVLGLAHEDFGLTPLEGNTFGKPALALRAGGYLDTIVEGVTGAFVDALDVADVIHGVNRLVGSVFDAEKIRHHAAAFSIDAFGRRLRSAVIDAYEGSRSLTPGDRQESR